LGRRPYPFPAGYGIIGMSERAASLNGTFEAKNRPAEVPQEIVLQ
jgi:signal transduction histidine kinase